MKFIAHRGNTQGPSKQENHPTHIFLALGLGFDAEIDVWWIDNKFILGHDNPNYEVSENFLQKNGLWCHAKNIETFDKLLDNKKIHSFFHQNDDCTLTSKKYIWTYPKNLLLGNKSIAVIPERVPDWNLSKAAGICSDYVEEYKKL